MNDVFHMLALLVLAHLLADYPLQGDFLARAKNHTTPVPGVPWQTALLSHAAIHAGFVYVITNTWWCAATELVAHVIIDHLKCRKWFGFNYDQALHLLLKVSFACLVAGAPHA